MTLAETVKEIALLILKRWRLILCLTMPLLLSPILLTTGTRSAKAGYLLLLLTLYLMLELLPLAATIMLILFLIPTIGLATTEETAKYFMNDTIFLLIAVLVMAVSIEEVNLHNRLALLTLRAIGVSPSRLILGFLLVSGFLSMWMANFAVTVMILPISMAITKTLVPDDPVKVSQSRRNTMIDVRNINDRRSSSFVHERRRPSAISTIQPLTTEMLMDKIEEDTLDEAELQTETTKFLKRPSVEIDEKRPSIASSSGAKSLLATEENSVNLKKAFQLSIAFGSNIGGMATLIGSYISMLLRITMESNYGTKTEFNFLSYSLVAVPIVAVSLLATWVFFCLLYVPGWLRSWNRLRPTTNAGVMQTLNEKLAQLGPISDGEISVMVISATVIALWLTRDPGWNRLLPEKVFATDALPVLLGAVFLFIVPSDFKALRVGQYEPLMQWKKVVARIPWEFVLFAGCLTALSKLCGVSGFTGALARAIPNLTRIPSVAVMIIISVVASFLSEVMGNILISAILLPVFANIAENMSVNPLYYMMAITFATQMTFLTPLSSFCNLIVYNSGSVSLKDIVKSGIGPKIFCLLMQIASLHFIGSLAMNIQVFPDWALQRRALRTAVNLTTFSYGSSTFPPTANLTG